jgi:TPR repeat protein
VRAPTPALTSGSGATPEMTDHLAWDGKLLWGNVHPMTTHPDMVAKLIGIDVQTRQVVRTIEIPFGDAATMSPMGMGFDGTHLWTNDGKNRHMRAKRYAEARRAFENATKHGDAEGYVGSTMFLGNLYNGLGPEFAPAKAAHRYLEVCNQHQSTALDVAEARDAVEQLLPLLVTNAHAGDADAAFVLGGWHMSCDVDHVKAAEWFEQAASMGHAGAQRSLGFLLEHGQGIAKNERRAIELYEAAAAGGDRFAQYNLGSIYAHGTGLPKDPERAIAHLSAAAEQGFAEAMALLGDDRTA